MNDEEFNCLIARLSAFEDARRIIDKVSVESGPKHKEGFAVLESQHCKHYITKPCTVIGRAKRSTKSRFTWDVDIDLGLQSKVSKQHAVILFNFETRAFELKCLSAKYSVSVDKSNISLADSPVVLDNGSVIAIGNQVFSFFMAATQEAN